MLSQAPTTITENSQAVWQRGSEIMKAGGKRRLCPLTFYVREAGRVIDRQGVPLRWFSPHETGDGQGRARLTLGAGSSIQVPHMGGRDPAT